MPRPSCSTPVCAAAKVADWGDWDPLRVVIIEFPDMDAARGWYHSDGYAPLRELRRGASVTNIVLVEGT